MATAGENRRPRTRARRHPGVWAALSTLVLMAAPVAAAAPAESGAAWVMTSGVVDPLERRATAHPAVSVEWRGAGSWHGLHPWAGLAAGTAGERFLGGGVCRHWRLAAAWNVGVGTGPFFYRPGRDGPDLGFDLEFHSWAEITRDCGRRGDLGLRVAHLSNGGLGRDNPGAEIVSLVWATPWRRERP